MCDVSPVIPDVYEDASVFKALYNGPSMRPDHGRFSVFKQFSGSSSILNQFGKCVIASE